MTKQADLIDYLFAGQPHLLAGELFAWLEASPRFTTFVETYRDKIRKKIRVIRESESILDLRSELEVAYRLLNDRRLEVAYEPYASAKIRGPDFAVTYRVNLVFNIEVARMHLENGNDLQRIEERFLRLLLYKLGQMQPGKANLLVIHAGAELAPHIDLERFMQAIKTRVEKKDPTFYAASHYTSPADFYKDFLHLSAILVWTREARLWINKQARPALDEKVSRLVGALAVM